MLVITKACKDNVDNNNMHVYDDALSEIRSKIQKQSLKYLFVTRHKRGNPGGNKS